MKKIFISVLFLSLCSFVVCGQGTCIGDPAGANFRADGAEFFLEEDGVEVLFEDLSSGPNLERRWDFGDPYSSDNSSVMQNPSHVYTQRGTYTIWLYVETNGGCVDSTSREIKIIKPYNLYIPNAFSPNGDNINDYFAVKGEGVSYNNFEMLIYNRNGEIMFRSQTPYDTWDGRDRKGNYCPIGVYAYIVRLVTEEGEPHEFIGNVTLVR